MHIQFVIIFSHVFKFSLLNLSNLLTADRSLIDYMLFLNLIFFINNNFLQLSTITG